MRMTHIGETEYEEFAKKAVKCFEAEPKAITYSEHGEPKNGELYAIRYGLGNDCVVVFRVHDFDEIVNFQQCIKGDTRTTLGAST